MKESVGTGRNDGTLGDLMIKDKFSNKFPCFCCLLW